MSLEQYNKLLGSSQSDLGVQLPMLTPASLYLTSEKTTLEHIKQKITELAPTSGWVMYRDNVEINTNTPVRNDLIEAEYNNNGVTLKVKHLFAEQYQLTRFETVKENEQQEEMNTTQYCFSEQEIYVRNHLKSDATTATYRLWYKLDNHRWSPFAQQFIGFNKEAI